MAAPTNYDQTNAWLAEIGQLSQDLIKLLKAGVEVAESGELGNLALVDSLSAAPVGDLAALQQALQIASVANRGVVGGSGDLMAVGFAGVGTGPGRGKSNAFLSNQNLNTFVDSGEFFIGGINNTNTPSGNSSNICHLKVSNNNTDFNRVFHDAMESVSGVIIKAHRYSNDRGATWSPWDRSYGRRDLIGTVSMASGIPSGAAFQVTQNSNGRALLLADGTAFVSGTFLFDLSIDTIQAVPNVISLISGSIQGCSISAVGGVTANNDELISKIFSRPTSADLRLQIRHEGTTTTPVSETLSLNYSYIARWN